MYIEISYTKKLRKFQLLQTALLGNVVGGGGGSW